MYFIRNLIIIAIVSLLSGCIMGSPYGGAIFVAPIDFIKIIFKSKDERISPSKNTQSETNYSSNKELIIKNNYSILKSKIIIDEKDYKIDKIAYH